MKETSPKKISKKFEIPLDKTTNLWYNVNVNKGEQVEQPLYGAKLNGGFDSPHAPKKNKKGLDKSLNL